MILSPDQESVIQLFEALGFSTSHSLKTEVEGFDLNVVRMKNEDGFHVDVADVKAVPQDLMLIRMNVDDFDEAYALLKEKGFVIWPLVSCAYVDYNYDEQTDNKLDYLQGCRLFIHLEVDQFAVKYAEKKEQKMCFAQKEEYARKIC